VSPRRRTTIKSGRHHAHETPYQVAKQELEQRLARLESSYAVLSGGIEFVEKRVAALQAQLDHLTALLLGRS
jgi:chaperonin cofactor prefoldin